MEMMIITSGLRTIHHRDTERTEDAQRKKKRKLWVGITRVLFFRLDYGDDDYNHGASAHKRNLG
jgi:hypothetical protein